MKNFAGRTYYVLVFFIYYFLAVKISEKKRYLKEQLLILVDETLEPYWKR
jgi:hypothetical protein